MLTVCGKYEGREVRYELGDGENNVAEKERQNQTARDQGNKDSAHFNAM